MLYFRALQQGLAAMPSADPAVREKIVSMAKEFGWGFLHARLAKVDSPAAARIHPNDTQRIQRALEVYELTGKSLTEWQQNNSDPLSGFRVHALAIAPHDRSILHARIAERFTLMLENGLIDEVKKLFERGDLTLETPAIRSVGYREVWDYLLGNTSFEVMRERGIIATRQLAKRQLTWLRSWPDVVWFDSESSDLFQQVGHYLTLI